MCWASRLSLATVSVLLAMSATVSPWLPGLLPGGDDVGFHLIEGAAVESSVALVFDQGGGVAVAEPEARDVPIGGGIGGPGRVRPLPGC